MAYKPFESILYNENIMLFLIYLKFWYIFCSLQKLEDYQSEKEFIQPFS